MNYNTSNSLPTVGFIRLKELIGSKLDPSIPAIIPLSRSSIWAEVKDGSFPAPVKPFGPKITCWLAEDIRKFIESAGGVKP